MTLEEELEKLENDRFYLQMKDHWSRDDYALDTQYHDQIKELEEKINGSNNGKEI